MSEEWLKGEQRTAKEDMGPMGPSYGKQIKGGGDMRAKNKTYHWGKGGN